MKTVSLLLCVLLLSSTAFAADVTGTWLITVSGTNPDGTERTDSGMAVLKQEGNVITGTIGPDANRQSPIAEGTIKDDKITLKTMPQPNRTMAFELAVKGEKLTGTVERTGSTEKGKVEFVKAAQK
jgi:hypothetical protein